MNKLSYRLILLITLCFFLISLVMLSKTEESFKDEFDRFAKYNKLGSLYSSLSSSWLKQNSVERQLDNILKISHIKNFNKTKDSKTIRIKLNTKIQKIDRFVNKLLNKNFIIKQLVIKKDSLVVVVEY